MSRPRDHQAQKAAMRAQYHHGVGDFIQRTLRLHANGSPAFQDQKELLHDWAKFRDAFVNQFEQDDLELIF